MLNDLGPDLLPVDDERLSSMRIVISDDPPPAVTDDVAGRWAQARAANPRLFDGPVLSLIDEHDGALLARRDSYQRLTVQCMEPALVEPRVWQLSLTGVLVARDERGIEHTLLGRRSHETRVYGGLWEFAPGGGIDAPEPGAASLSGADIFDHLLLELREEVGLPADGIEMDRARVIGLTPDPAVGSVDIVIRLDLPHALESCCGVGPGGEHRWEYERVEWVGLSSLRVFAQDRELIPPASSIVKALTG